jgi:hypothetical protein
VRQGNLVWAHVEIFWSVLENPTWAQRRNKIGRTGKQLGRSSESFLLEQTELCSVQTLGLSARFPFRVFLCAI